MESEDKVAAQESGEELVQRMVVEEVAEEAAENGHESEEGQGEEMVAEGSVEEGLKLGLLDRPLVQEGRRKAHSVQRLQMLSPEREKKKSEILPGKGISLGEIQIIVDRMQRSKSDEFRVIHRLAFGRPGQNYEIKRNIRAFSGFPFGRDDEQFEKKRVFLAKYPPSVVRETCDQLCLSPKGRKEDLIDRILEFCLKPSQEAVSARTLKRRRSSVKKSPARPKTAKTIEDSDDEDTSPKKKPRPTPKKTEKKVDKKMPVKSPKSSSRRKQSAPKKIIKVATVTSDTDSSDDEPLSKKLRPFPSDEDLEEACRLLLEKADLDSVSVKAICLEVYKKYAEHDLSSKKDFLKSTIKELYGNMV